MNRFVLTVLLFAHLTLAACYNLAGSGKLEVYARITGLAGGYGFFAPQVGSPCYLEIGLADSNASSPVLAYVPRFTGNEARLRYHSFSTIYLDLLPQQNQATPRPPTEFKARLAKAFARSIAESVGNRKHQKIVYCKVFVYQHSFLHTFRAHPDGARITLYAYQYPTLTHHP